MRCLAVVYACPQQYPLILLSIVNLKLQTGPAPPTATNTRKPQRTQPTPESDNDDEDTSSGNGATEEDASDEEVESEVDASADESEDNEGEAKDADEVMQDAAPLGVDAVPTHSEKKRKRKDVSDDLEDRHMRKLMRDNKDKEPSSKRQRGVNGESKESGVKGLAGSADEDSDDDARPVHESLAKDAQPADIEKANRTVFLANVSTDAVSSKEAVKTLRAHLSSILDETANPKERIESIRFRSLAFSSLALPKRAAYITGSLMDATTKSCNAYVVYSTPTAARKAISGLNGTKVLERHLRVDSVAHPGKVDHRRCVFVGNLGFVDDETVLNTDKEGKTSSKKRYKVPSDIEEGLWRVFGEKAGKVENVRVIRDPKTRVGKGFAYVQFYVSFGSYHFTTLRTLLLSTWYTNDESPQNHVGHQPRRGSSLARRQKVSPHAPA